MDIGTLDGEPLVWRNPSRIHVRHRFPNRKIALPVIAFSSSVEPAHVRCIGMSVGQFAGLACVMHWSCIWPYELQAVVAE